MEEGYLPIRKPHNFEVMGHKRVLQGKTGLCKSVKSAGLPAAAIVLDLSRTLVACVPGA